MEHVLGEGDGHWQGLYIILRGREEGQWPLINTIFTRRAEKDGADSISETLPFTASLSHATVNKRKTEREINFGLLFFFFYKELSFPVSQADADGWQRRRNEEW